MKLNIDHRTKHKTKDLKFPGENVCNVEISKDFFNRTPKPTKYKGEI